MYSIKQLDTNISPTHFITHELAETGQIHQHTKLQFQRTLFYQSTLIYVVQGSKTLRYAGGEYTAHTGEWLLIAGNQSFDVINRPQDGTFIAKWLSITDELIGEFLTQYSQTDKVNVAKILKTDERLLESFGRISLALEQGLPQGVVWGRIWELLAWLAHHNAVFHLDSPDHLTYRIRQMIAKNPDQAWQCQDIAKAFNISESTLRRQLAERGVSFRTLLTQIRLMRALTLLQTTQKPIAQIAESMGYESAARFGSRFKAHFGFMPSDVRKAK